jgi:hypothetical protein
MIARPGKVTLRHVAHGLRIKRSFAGFFIIAGLLFCRFHQKGRPRRVRRYASEFGYSAA